MKVILAAVALLLLVACAQFSSTTTAVDLSTLKLNEIQFIGSHNSYKKAIDPPLLAQLAANNQVLAMSLDYAHLPLFEQLDLGLRKLELDVFYDPKGELYDTPLGLKMTDNASSYTQQSMRQPGFKVLHVQDVDFRSHCQRFTQCLQQLRSWSLQNEGHLPIVVTVNAKDQKIPRAGFTQPLKFDTQAWLLLDSEIRLTLEDKLYTPDDFRGGENTLAAAVKRGWPSLNAMRSKVLVVLDHEGEKLASYIKDHPALMGRAMFVNAKEGSAEAAIRIVNNPIDKYDYIQSLVKSGYIVRTRADADTVEARNGSTKRREKAFSSGAQIISTDYYVEDPRFSSGYQVSLPAGAVAICNRLLVAHHCTFMGRN